MIRSTKITTSQTLKAAAAFARIAICIVLLAFTAGVCRAQSATVLDSATVALEALDYSRAQVLLSEFVRQPGGATPAALAQAHLLLGIIDYSENRLDAAQRQFASAIQLEPTTELDTRLASPKIVEFFEQIKVSASNRNDTAEPRYLTIVDPRPAAALRSMVMPGWGQLYKGERTKASLAASAWVITVGATAVANGRYHRAKDRYLEETNAELIPDRYASFNDAQKLRKTLAVTGLAVWLVSYIDALATPGTTTIGRSNISVHPDVRHAGIKLRWNVQW